MNLVGPWKASRPGVFLVRRLQLRAALHPLAVSVWSWEEGNQGAWLPDLWWLPAGQQQPGPQLPQSFAQHCSASWCGDLVALHQGSAVWQHLITEQKLPFLLIP